jgi:predicted AAA+ superfamily ATPase
MSKEETVFQRPQATILASRLAEPRRFMQVVAGPRQVGKSTLVQQVAEGLGCAGTLCQRGRADAAWRGLD